MKIETVLAVGILAVAIPLAIASEPIVLKPNGGWCWFQDPRAVVTKAGEVVFTTISGDTFAGYEAGDLWATSWHPVTGETSHFELHDQFERDDHDVAGLLERPDGKILAVYGKHGTDHHQRWRVTQRPGDISAWTEEETFDAGAGYTYSNVYRLPAEDGRVYNFSRTIGRNPHCSVSHDGGETWAAGWRLLHWERSDFANNPKYTGIDGARPYLRYASNGADTIHFVTTEDHPRAFDNSLYHGFYRAGKLHGSRGEELGSAGSAEGARLTPESFTRVFEGGRDRVAWACDLELDADGHPYVAFSVQVDGGATRGRRVEDACNDHRYWYARFDGERWHAHEMARAGTKLYAAESDYTGLVALDPDDRDIAVISTNADPVTGAPLVSKTDGNRHWELFRGQTADGGKTWKWEALTADSDADNLRPVVPSDPGGKRIILWCRGELRNYTDYRLDVCALAEDRTR